MYKLFTFMMSVLFTFSIVSNKVVERRFEQTSITIKDEFERSCKSNLNYFVENDVLALNFTDVEEDLINKISSLKTEVNYSFSYEGNCGFAYPLYVKRINLKFWIKSGLKIQSKMIYASLEGKSYEGKI